MEGGPLAQGGSLLLRLPRRLLLGGTLWL